MHCESFSERAEKAIDTHSVISFDIFDTLIVRPYVRPTDLFIHLEKINNCDEFAERRALAERLAHENTNAEEVTLDEIYEHIPSKLKKFKDIEIQLEYDVVRPNPEIQRLYNYALKKGKKLIITTDMYLPRQAIEKMLSKCGYNNYYKLYLSSECRKTKNSSNLYSEILNELKVVPENIVHIGDNYFSDYTQAKKVGIDALYYPKLTDSFLNNPHNEKFKKFYEQNEELFRSIVVSQLAYKQKQTENLIMDKSKYWYDVGYQICGPFVYTFCDFVSKQPFLKTCGNVAFIGRDGYVPWKVFQILYPNVPAKYVYVPRIIGRVCNSDWLRGLSMEDCNEIYKNYCAHDFGVFKFNSLEAWIVFVKQHADYLKKLSNRKREEYKKYMSSQCNLNQNLMIVDSCANTWTVQKLLQGIFNSGLMGCYVCTSHNDANADLKSASFFKAVKNSHQLHKFINWNFVEFMMSSSEPPIVDIVNNEAIFKRQSSEEKIPNEIHQHIVSGAMDFALDANNILKNSNMNSEAVLDLINDYSNYPNSDDVKYRCQAIEYKDITHSLYHSIFFDKVKVTVLSLFSFDSVHGERFTRFFHRLPFLEVVTTPGAKIIYLFGALPIIIMQRYLYFED